MNPASADPSAPDTSAPSTARGQRDEATARATHAQIEARFGSKSLRFAVTGASGLVGARLVSFLGHGGHEVVSFVRHPARNPSERQWNPSDLQQGLDPEDLRDIDVVVHLAGESIASSRWTKERKQRILESRTHGTALMARAIARCSRPPIAFLCASAIGFYGPRDSEPVDEMSGVGEGFLAEVVSAWEDAAQAARVAGVRTVHLRLGVVLSASGGALKEMLLPFRCGLGGPIGNGKQGFSWVSLDDVLGAVLFAARHESLAGAVNVVAPTACSQREFARALGHALHRPSFAPLPAVIVRMIFGEMGQRLLLDGAFVRPRVLQRDGFCFTHASLAAALAHELG